MQNLLTALFFFCFLNLNAQTGNRLFNYAETTKPPAAEAQYHEPLAAKATLNLDLKNITDEFSVALNLPQGIEYNLTAEKIDRRHPVGNVDIYYGSTGDPAWAHLPHYRDVVMTVNRNSGNMVMHIFSADGTFNVMPNADGTYRVSKEETPDCISDRHHGFNAGAQNFLDPAKMMMSGCNEQDDNNDYVVDMYFGYSHQAAAQIGDIQAYSVAQIETVNVGFQNSLVTDIYLRLVNLGVSEHHVGVIGGSINTFFDHFQEDFNNSGADMGAFYDSFFPGANNGGGFAGVPGRASINAAASGAVFRHEWGHNSGSRHCPTDGGGTATYASGWNNGNGATHMCGNAINFFSNPNINDAQGDAIGDAVNGDNTRNITERRTVYSGYAKHITPYDAADTGAACPLDFAQGRYTIQNVASGNFLSPTGTGAQGDGIDQATAQGSTELWDIVHFRADLYTIYNAATGRVLDVFSSSSSPGANVGLWTTNGGSSNQLWKLEEQASGNFTLSPNSNSLCLQVINGESAEGDLVIQDICDGTTDAEWILTPNAGTGNAALTFAVADVDASCAGSEDGSATVIPTGGSGSYTYAWETGGTAATEPNLSAGDYVVTVTSAGRSYFTTVNVGGSVPLIPEYTTTNNTPTAGGTIDITNVQNASGATTYAWSDGGTGATRNGLAGGTYTVTITSGGCTDVQEIRIFDGLDPGTEYVIQHLASGLYLQPRNGSLGQSAAIVLGNCPTDAEAYRWRADAAWANVFRFRNQEAGSTNRYLTVRDQGAVGDSLRLTGWTSGNTENFVLTQTGAGTFTLRSNANDSGLSVSGNNAGDFILQTDPGTGAADDFVFIPIVACNPDASGTACDDNDTTTDDDQVNLLCGCCGVPNECFGIGDADSDKNCTDTDCDDNDDTVFLFSPCDDADANTVGDATDESCACVGRPMTCTETGNGLDNVARVGTATVRNTLGSSPGAEVLNDGNLDGIYDNGTVWHSSNSFSWANIELLQEEMIKEVTVYPRTDCCNTRLNGVYILVSDVPFSDPDLSLAQLIAEADFAHEIPTNYNSTDPYTVTVNTLGRHVRLKANSEFMNLAEIEVRTCPQASAALPVELLSFTGETAVKSNDLFWSTVRESNNAGFTIQRSLDNRTFTDIGYTAGAGDSETETAYTFSDQNPPRGTAFYRLLQTDFDGTESYSAVISLTRTDGKDWQIYPNPLGTGRTLTVSAAVDTEFELLSLNGKLLNRFAPGSTRLSLADLPAGVYLLRNRADGMTERVLVY